MVHERETQKRNALGLSGTVVDIRVCAVRPPATGYLPATTKSNRKSFAGSIACVLLVPHSLFWVSYSTGLATGEGGREYLSSIVVTSM